MLGELVRAVPERALESEMAAHLGYEKSERGGAGGNARNGATAKTVQTGVGPVPLQVPRDRAGTFEPLLVPKRAGRIAGGLDDMVISLYARGMSVRDAATAGEGARFWGGVMSDLRNRGVRDILIACCDGLSGFEDAITGAFPRDVVQRCVVLIRNALRPVARRDAVAVAAGLRKIYTAPTAGAAFDALAAFASPDRGKKYPQAVRVFEDARDAFTPFLAFSPPVRKLLCTTNAREPELPAPQGHQGPRPLPDRRRRRQAPVARHHQHRGQRTRERLARRQETGKRSDQPARLVEGQRVMGWREALSELDTAYPDRLR
jgi:putative transposase